MGGMTLLSRILGMVRDIVSARAFGTTWQWDAFLYAFMLPNFFRRLVGEGALSSAFIPVYSEILAKQGGKEAFRFANMMLNLILMGFAVFLLAAEAALALVLRSGLLPERLLLVVDLLRYFFPYLAIMAIYALWMGILNAHRRFLAAAFGPVVLNVVWIGGTFWVMRYAGAGQAHQLRLLALIMFSSGFIQLLFEWPSLGKLGYRPRRILDLAYPGIQRTAALLFPVAIGFAVMQINLLVSMTLSFWIGPGANSTLWYGNRLMQFPLGIFAVGMGTAILPALAGHVAAGDRMAAEKDLSFALRTIFLVVLPCSAGLMVLSAPIVRLLFEHGEFGPDSTARTARVLLFFSAGLLAHAGQRIVTAGFHASQNTKTPVKVAAFVLVFNIILSLALMRPLREAGLALATTLSGFVQFALLAWFFHRRLIRLPVSSLLSSLMKIIAASAFMGFFALWSYETCSKFLPGAGTAAQAGRLFSSIAASAVFYGLLCFLFRIEEVRDLARFIRRKTGPKPEAGHV